VTQGFRASIAHCSGWFWMLAWLVPVLAAALVSINPVGTALAYGASASECVADAQLAQPPVMGLTLLQARTRWRGAPSPVPWSLLVTLEVDTSDDPYAGTTSGAAYSFKVNGSWTEEEVFCEHAELGESITKTTNLTAWPSHLRLSALGSDAWGYTRIEVRYERFVITVLDGETGNSSYGSGSLHWVDGNEQAPLSNTYAVSEIEVQVTGSEPKPHVHKGEVAGGSPSASENCTTRYDTRATAFGYKTSPSGTPCVFGVEPRDEGSHCIMDNGDYGSFGWCYTSEDGSSFGSCSESCPLFGPAKILGDKLDDLRAAIEQGGKANTNLTKELDSLQATLNQRRGNEASLFVAS